MSQYRFGEHSYGPCHEHWQRILQKGYSAKVRPVCMCIEHGRPPELYIALARGQYVLKRMPYSGPLHAPFCDHYEPPSEMSGLGQVAGSAIREDSETATTVLSLDFALSKGRSRHVNAASEIEHESVRSDGTKLTMRGLLHYLMDGAGLTRWTPGMLGKRTWYVVRREIMQAASSMTAKGLPLSELLYLPETFSVERAAEIHARQVDSLSRLTQSVSARMVLLGEVKVFEDARFGKRLVVKHMPELKLMMSDDLYKHMTSRFERQLQMWGQIEDSHLLVLATISRSSQGIYALESACLMNVNDQWIPFESMFEYELLATLHNERRKFTKGLRYNLPSSKPLACAVLHDTGSFASALFVVPQGMEGEYETMIEGLLESGRSTAWRWLAGAQTMPSLPEIEAPSVA